MHDRRLLVTTDDVSDLPAELRKELLSIRVDALEHQVIEVMEAVGEPVALDHVLVGLYRKFKVVQERQFMQNKLYRMYRKGLIVKAGSKRYAFKPRAK